MKMPGFDGEKLYDLVETEKPDLAEHIIFVTGDMVSPRTQKFLERIGNPFIAKPFDVEQIQKLILKNLPDN